MTPDTVHAQQDDRFAALADRAKQDHPESWVPSDDDPLLIGEFVRLDDGTTSYGPQKIAVLRTQDGRERGVWLLHAVLKDEFAKAKPRRGELVAVRYQGRKKSASGQSYAAYRVVVDREQQPADWDAVADEPVPEPALTETHAGDDEPPF